MQTVLRNYAQKKKKQNSKKTKFKSENTRGKYSSKEVYAVKYVYM